MDRAPLQGLYRFGDFELDTLRRRLIARADSTPVPLTSKVFDTLLYLAERPGQLIEKRELMEALWPNVVVEESNLTQAIHTLRRALGERPAEHRYIVTVPGRGYRFVAPVESVDRDMDATSDRVTPALATPAASILAPTPKAPLRRGSGRRWAVAALVFGALAALLWWRSERSTPAAQAAPSHSLAVLPFADLSPGGDQAYFADGLAEEILNLLVRIPDLRVIARTSSFAFRDGTADIQQVRERLGVTHVLEGSVRKAGEHVRVTVQLIDAKTSTHLWSSTYERELRDVFEVQDAIATAIAEALGVKLSNTEVLAVGAETGDPMAHEQYLQGLYFLNRRQPSDIGRARDAFEKATHIDPRYSRAWSGLAATWFVETGDRALAPAEAQRWREATVHALESGPDLAEAHMRAAQYLMWSGEIGQARRHFHKATTLQPSDPLVLGLRMAEASVNGRLSESLDFARQLAANDPVSAVRRSNLGTQMLAMGQYREAAAELRRAAELGLISPDNQSFLCKALVLDGRFDEALAAIDREAGPLADQCTALVHQARGERAAAEAILARLETLGASRQEDWVLHLTNAELQAAMGNIGAAFASLQSAAASAPISGSPFWSWQFVIEMQISPLLAPLHADPRWASLIADRRTTWERSLQDGAARPTATH